LQHQNEVKQPSWPLPLSLYHLQTLRECPKGKQIQVYVQSINSWFQKFQGLISNPDKVRKSEREKKSFSTRQYQEHVFQFDLEKQISLKTLYLFSASVELQSFRFLNPNNPFLFQYSAPTLKHCDTVNRKVQVDINRVSTNHQPSQRPSEFAEFTEFFF
jgi:hypothetical protein